MFQLIYLVNHMKRKTKENIVIHGKRYSVLCNYAYYSNNVN